MHHRLSTHPPLRPDLHCDLARKVPEPHAARIAISETVSFKSSISPPAWTSTLTLRPPFAIAVVARAIARICAVRMDDIVWLSVS
jgi:hypothetical protein